MNLNPRNLIAADWTTDSQGWLGGVRYHDGSLVELGVTAAAVRVAVCPVGGGLTVFDLTGDVVFGSTSLVGGDVVVDIWAFRLAPESEAMMAMEGGVAALYGGSLREDDLAGAVQRLCVKNAGRLLVTFACVTGEFSVLADRMSVEKSGY
ncbi:hypothetical protein [Brevundimonas sp.]